MNLRREIRGSRFGAADPVDGPQELGQVGFCLEVELAAGRTLGVDVPEAPFGRQIVAVAVDVLAEQRQLDEAGLGDALRLRDHVVEGAAALGSTAERHDAVGAGFVAAVDDGQPRRNRRGAGYPAFGQRDGAVGCEVVGGADGPAAHRRCGGRFDGLQADRRLGGDEAEAARQLGFLVGPQEHVDGLEPARQSISLGFSNAATGKHHSKSRSLALQSGELALAADHLRLGVLADGTGVDDDQVGRLHRRGSLATGGEELPGHFLGIADVHLAAECPHVKAGHGHGFRPEFSETRLHDRWGRLREPGHQCGASAGEFGRACRRARHEAAHGIVAPSSRGKPRDRYRAAASSSGTNKDRWASAYVSTSPW